LPLVDWVGMDIKAPFEDYAKITKAAHSGKRAQECVRLVIDSRVDYEFRTTVHPYLLSPSAIDRMTEQISLMGAKRFVLQKFRPNGCKNAELNHSSFNILWEKEFLAQIKARFENFFVR